MPKEVLVFTALLCSLLLFGCGSRGRGEAHRLHAPGPAPVQPPPPQPVGQTGRWRLLFQDEFNGSELDADRWVTCYWWDDEGCTIATNNELQWYRPENVFVEDGKLVLRAQARPFTAPDGRRFDYTSGMVSTGSSVYRSGDFGFTAQQVYVEMRAKVPEGKGLWPAFWLLPASYTSLPEIDVMEVLGDDPAEVYMTFHYRGQGGERTSAGYSWSDPEPLGRWRVFALDWRAESLTWYLDGVERARFAEGAQVPDEPMYLVANLAVGGDWAGAPDSDTPFPSDFEIDYIRVWTRD